MITTAAFLSLAMQCAPDVAPDTLARIVKTESSFNEWAIGVVGKPLKRQPRNKEEALSAVKKLTSEKANFSVGLGQINIQHFDIEDVESIFSPCTNLRMAGEILKGCYSKAYEGSSSKRHALEKTFSCYYSGNYKRGFVKEESGTSYVDRIVAVNTAIKVPALDDEETPGKPSKKERPTYDAWDVLQQYPRYSSPKNDGERNIEKTTEEQNDVEA